MEDPQSNLILPFAVIEREGAPAEEFPFDMTLATILADVEKQREKAGMLRKREESVEFASLLYWPVIVAPWREGRHLVFDGMGVWSYVFTQGAIPDAKGFAAAVDAARGADALATFLGQRAATFDAFANLENIPIMGLFIHEEFMRDILAHLALARPREIRGNPVLEARLSPAHARMAVQRMRGIVDAMLRDRDSLAIAANALERALDVARRDLQGRREATTQAFGKKIDAIRPDVNAKVMLLEKEREARWSAMQPKLLDLQAMVRKSEADFAAWDAEARRRDDLAAASRGRERRDAAHMELEHARNEVAKYQDEMRQVRENADRQIQAQWERIRELERQRDAEIAQWNAQEQNLTALVGKMSLGIGGLTRQLEEGIRFLESQGVQATLTDVTTVRLPIMVASFVSDRGRRLVVYPPMVAKAGKGVLGGIKSTFGGAVLPLEPKTEQFEQIFRAGIEKALGEDASLSAYLTSVGNGNNLLHLANLRTMLSQGLARMKAQGWIKDKHERELLGALERHIASAARTAPKGGGG